MSEDQKPFTHQDGTSTPPGPTPAAGLLSTHALAGLVTTFKEEEEIVLASNAFGLVLDGDREQLQHLRRAIDTVQLLQEPRINTTVGALKRLTPNLQALVSDMAIALVLDGDGHKLANALRKLIEGRS